MRRWGATWWLLHGEFKVLGYITITRLGGGLQCVWVRERERERERDLVYTNIYLQRNQEKDQIHERKRERRKEERKNR